MTRPRGLGPVSPNFRPGLRLPHRLPGNTGPHCPHRVPRPPFEFRLAVDRWGFSDRCRICPLARAPRPVVGYTANLRRPLHEGHRMEEHAHTDASPNHQARLAVWNELRATNLLPPTPVDGGAGTPRGRFEREKTRIPGREGLYQLALTGRSRTDATPPATLGTPAGTPAASRPQPRAPWGVRFEALP